MYAGAMRLDGPTLGNLEVLTTPEGHSQGSLLARLDTCVYPGDPCQLSRCPKDKHDLSCMVRTVSTCCCRGCHGLLASWSHNSLGWAA